MQCNLLTAQNINESNLRHYKQLLNIKWQPDGLYNVSGTILSKTSILNKSKKKKNTLELFNPKVIRHKKDILGDIEEENISMLEKSSPENPISSAFSQNKKDSEISRIGKEKDYKRTKGKHKKKGQELSKFESDQLTSFNRNQFFKMQGNNLAQDTNQTPSKIFSQDNLSLVETELSQPTEIVITGSMAIKDLAVLLNKTETELIKFLFLQGIAVTINESIDISTIELICQHYNIHVIVQKLDTNNTNIRTQNFHTQKEELDTLEKRAPIVAVLGHVDHGKTSLLDQIRKSNIADGEAGGITQGLTAYSVHISQNGKTSKIVFLDTPGHAAFAQMRSRGALVMDIAVLVIAADDIIQPQTLEAIQHIREAQVPMIVAINKIDKETADIKKIKEQLTEQGIVPEDWGGDTIVIPLSAITGQNISQLLDSILIVAEIQNLQASYKGNGIGIIIEAHIDKNRGVAATLLIQQGTIKKGDIILAHTKIGKIRIITDESHNVVTSAGPSTIATVWGFSEIPPVGSSFNICNSEKEAKVKIKNQANQSNSISEQFVNTPVVFNLSDHSLKKDIKVLNLVIKSNTQGSLEAVLHVLKQIPQKKVVLHVLSSGVGEITETDVVFASTTKAIILGFDTTFAPGAKHSSNRLNVLTYDYQVIYDLVDSLQKHMSDLLDPEYDKNEIGSAIVKNIFPLAKGTVAGCYVESGKLIHNCSISVIRQSQVIYEGKLDSLKRVKEDVEEITSGHECGILIKNFQDWQKTDFIKAFELTLKKPSLV